MVAGRFQGLLAGYEGCVNELAVSGNVLCSGGGDGTVRVLRMDGDGSTWGWERTLDVESGVWCAGAWEGRVASGSGDGGIRVWGTETRWLQRTLRGHNEDVIALMVSGGRLISSSRDRTVRVWSTETWGCVRILPSCGCGFSAWR